MPGTPLHDALAAAGARFGQFGGAETAASFGDVAKEYAALNSGAGVYDLGRRAKILVTGNDRTRWLNGMVTNNIRDLAPGHGNYNFLLNAQGHILADMYMYNRGDYFAVDTDQDQAARVMELFDKFIIMDEVETTDASEKLTAVGLAGPEAKEALAKLGLPVPAEPLSIADADWQNVGVSVVRNDAENEFEIWVGVAHVSTLWSALVAASATPVGYEALEPVRIAAGVPRFGVDIREKDLPQETAQQRALNFNKGCYLGQEIVERIHARGALHRTLAGFELEQGTATPGAKVSAGGKEVGQVTSVAQLPNGSQRTLALGYVRRESAMPGTGVEIEGARAKVSPLPFADRRTER
jgi:folate-binding protein YgfZ